MSVGRRLEASTMGLLPLMTSYVICIGGAVGCATEEVAPPAGVELGVDGKADSLGRDSVPSIYAIGNRLKPYSKADYYLDYVQPVVARQCVTCHGCGDSPCQLKLTSYESVLRGANEDDIYSARVLSVPREYDPTHMAWGRVLKPDGTLDAAATEAKWRKLDFYSVVTGRTQSLIARVLTEAHTLTKSLDQSYEVAKSLSNRNFECLGTDKPKASELVGRAMPLGLPALAQDHSAAVMKWLDAGAPGPSAIAQLAIEAPASRAAVDEWENFLNPSLTDARGRLVSRYLYEHLFFAHLHLEDSPGEFYRIVRSKTRTGPIAEIAAERAFDVPKDPAFYYRLEKVTSLLVAKSHVVWRLSPATMARWDTLFFGTDWPATSPIAEPESANPFAYFAPIPASIRYRFMLENSRELVDAMVRGSVCTGSGATFAIRDRFWVWFLSPEADVSALDVVAGNETGGPRLAQDSWFHLNPESANPLRERDYLIAYRELLQAHRPDGLGIEDLWDGNGGTNPNAWLTVLRHGKSATVHLGPQAGPPETLWILSYSNFERLYYNLVVQFKVWGHVAHKLETWALMAFVRSEGEDLGALLLPPELREELRDHPTRGWGALNSTAFPSYGECSDAREDAVGDDCTYPTRLPLPTPIGATSTERLDGQFAAMEAAVAAHIGAVDLADPLNGVGKGAMPVAVVSQADVEAALDSLTGWKSDGWQYLPELMLLRVKSDRERWLYTVVANRIYESHERVYQQALNRVTAEDTLSVSRGVIGNYPGLFADIPLKELSAFATELAAVTSKADWIAFVKRWMARGVVIDRQQPTFWTFLDDVHTQWFLENPEEAAVLDVSEYLWPQQLK